MALSFTTFQNTLLALEQPNSNTRLFIAFADEDKTALDSLLAHLSVLKDNYPFQVWHKGLVQPGADIVKANETELQQAHIVLLLVSSQFLAAEWFGELKTALNKLPETKVVPIIIKACAWQEDTYLNRLKVLPANETPLMSRRGGAKDEAFLEVTNGVKSLIATKATSSDDDLGTNKPARRKKRIRLATIWSFIGAVGLVAGLYSEFPVMWRDFVNWVSPTEQITEPAKPAFTPIFKTNTADTFNVLIVRFEDYITKLETECIGHSILEHLNVMKNDTNLVMALHPEYVHDSIVPPTDKEAALRIQKRHNADLIIYGLAKMEEQCSGADICFRYAISQKVVSNVAPEIDEPISRHGLDYVQTSPMSIQEGNFKIDAISMKYWISALMNVKAGEEDAAFVELYKLGYSNANATREEKAEKFILRGKAFYELGKYEKALEAYNNAIVLTPGNTNAYFNKAYIYFEINDYDVAFKVMDEAMRNIDLEDLTTKDFYIAYNGLGNLSFNFGDYDEAIMYYEKAIDGNPRNIVSHVGIGNTYLELKSYEKAIQSFKRATEINPNGTIAYIGLGRAYSDLMLYDEAEINFKKAIALNPDYADSYFYRGLLFLKLKEHKKAIQDFNVAINLDTTFSIAYYEKGLIYQTLKDYEKANWNFDKAISLNLHTPNAYYFRGTSYYRLKNYNKAIQDFDTSIVLDTTFAIAYYNRGASYRQLKDYKKAILNFDKAIELNPNYADAYNNRGNAYYEVNLLDKAIQDFKKILSINPWKLKPYWILARIYLLNKYWYLTLLAITLLLFAFRKRLKTQLNNFFRKEETLPAAA